MYSYIKGQITAKENGALTVEANGIGYLVTPTSTCFDAHKLGDITTLYTHLSVSDTAHTLYAFVDSQERELFKQLLTVSGVGAKTALSALSIGSSNISASVSAGNVSMLASAKGVSRKIAEKIVLELQDKFIKNFADSSIARTIPSNSETNDALAALVNLGISRNSALELIKAVGTKNMTAEEIILAALAKRGGAM